MKISLYASKLQAKTKWTLFIEIQCKYVYNVPVCLFYYIKWCQLVNLLPLDSAVLKLITVHLL